ncbi:hypothetical protein OIU34_18480 [Pararhizobium sp. BT-229]|uniref:hypothetical protein n=1 Tax=Pararhizobium sp. BT-229 TaxID=2986923 RepID=UPI0021F74962|nr:hypothetical protein [Pararhizobium sp. BT-229]MCV9963866.1 hypothetical protein [Pararhizobium sp. BT-229]
MNHPLSNATSADIQSIAQWLRREMIETGDNRYLDFVRDQNSSHSADVWAFKINNEVKAFATFSGPKEIETFRTHPSLSGSRKRLAGESLVAEFEGHGFNVVTFVGDDGETRELMKDIGFVQHKEADELALDLRKDIDLSNIEGRRVPFSIRFYAENHYFTKDEKPYAVTEGTGVITDLEELHLPKAAIAFGDIPFCPSKSTVEIEVDGELIARDHVYRNLIRYLGAFRDKADYVLHFEKIDLLTYKHLDFTQARTWL